MFWTVWGSLRQTYLSTAKKITQAIFEGLYLLTHSIHNAGRHTF